VRSRRQIKAEQKKGLHRKWITSGLITFIIIFIAGGGLLLFLHSQSNLETAAKTKPGDDLLIVSPTSSPSATHSSPKPSINPTASTANEAEKASKLIQMAFVGDILLASGVEDLMKKNGFDYPYKDVRDYLVQPDLTIGNLETSVTDRGKILKKEYNYRSPPLALPALAEAGVDLVNLANNHVMDYGPEGLLDTIDHLDKTGIQHIGAGHDATEAFKPVIIEKKGIKIAFLGFSHIVPDVSWKAGVNHPGVADTYDYKAPVLAIQKARAQADLVVVITHWGVERTDTPVPYQTDLAHRYIDAGADLVVGGHPHVLQGFEAYKGKWIAYSLGNFIFTTNGIKETLETFVLNASCSIKHQCALNVVPIFTKYAKPEKMNPEQGQALFDRISNVSFHAQIQPNGQIVEKP
jgi:poly-gamma-glutamate synthesis protein (capsule biosynthesis protein)